MNDISYTTLFKTQIFLNFIQDVYHYSFIKFRQDIKIKRNFTLHSLRVVYRA